MATNHQHYEANSSSKKKQNGVADYFAILGVGDKLIWKHAQKQQLYAADDEDAPPSQQQQQQQQTAAADETKECKNDDGGDEEEEEDEMLAEEEERFCREIVEITIMVGDASNSSNITTNNNNNSTNNSALSSIATNSDSTSTTVPTTTGGGASNNIPTQQQQQQHPPVVEHVTSYQTEGGSSSQDCPSTVLSSMPHSPSHSEATTTVTTATAAHFHHHHDAHHHRPPHHHAILSSALRTDSSTGWTIVQKTHPASSAGKLCLASDDDDEDADEALLQLLQADDDDENSRLHNHNSHNHHHHHHHHHRGAAAAIPSLWNKFHVWEANLSWPTGLRAEITARQDALLKQLTGMGSSSGGSSGQVQTPTLKGLRRKMESTLRNWQQKVKRNNNGGTTTSTTASFSELAASHKFFLAYRRRNTILDTRPAVAGILLLYLRLHRNSLVGLSSSSSYSSSSGGSSSGNGSGGNGNQNDNTPRSSQTTTTTTSAKVVPSNSTSLAGQVFFEGAFQSQAKHPEPIFEKDDEHFHLVSVQDYLTLPDGFTEWQIPEEYRKIRDPQQQQQKMHHHHHGHTQGSVKTTVLLSASAHDDETVLSGSAGCAGGGGGASGVGVEAVENVSDTSASVIEPEALLPKLVFLPHGAEEQSNYCYVPILALRRQRIGDEERYHEDPAIVELAVTFLDGQGNPVMPHESVDEDDEEDEENDEATFRVLGKTPWSGIAKSASPMTPRKRRRRFGSPTFLVRRNQPFGFADAAFATRVLDRFPKRNYKGLPLPEEELPMFCYPTGCRLFRARFSDAPLAQYYGFVVKNERGDSIYVSCVSFMEPLTTEKVNQLARMSEKRRRTSLPHAKFCERRERRKQIAAVPDMTTTSGGRGGGGGGGHHTRTCSIASDASTFLLTGFDDVTTFENKTICLVSRYPYWTAFRKFLSHLHILSGSTSDLPLERCISHLLLSVPIPRPGGPSVIIPLPALNAPMILSMPPEKDFPLVDLPYQPLVACLEIQTVVRIVLGMLALEKKIIVLSTRPSLVLDVCELLRSLLFPFELCAPYVPRLTEPFKTSLDFPGAIFVGIHDDASPNGLAATVRKFLPEDSIIIDLDTGEVDSDMDRQEIFKSTWDIIPASARGALVSELQALCRDAGIVDGQEPLDSQFDSAFDVALTAAVDDIGVGEVKSREPLDDRAVRDAFFRFFCSVLGGYERFLLVPDADFLVSGNEWFDSKGFLASTSSEKTPYLSALVSTQLFQSFIQRRTEASDVQCLLFDECMAEYHSCPQPYGRLGDDVEAIPSEQGDQPKMLYSLLVDQAASLPANFDQSTVGTNRSFDISEADSSTVVNILKSFSYDGAVKYAESAVNEAGDLVTGPSRQDLPADQRYIYCIDGNPCFPHKFNEAFFFPREPESWLVEMSKAPNPLLARSERELEDCHRRRRMATSYRGFQKQRRCLWQLPKLMGSHFLGSWLLCIPALVSQGRLSHDQQSRYLLRALGALRLMRSKQRIVPDEAAYRALMVACGRSRSDRRVELVKLFGLLRSDGVFPSAVTLGQYTRALAEGYSKRSTGVGQTEEDLFPCFEVTESASKVGRLSIVSLNQKGSGEFEASLSAMDGHLAILEDHGRRWRQRYGADTRRSAGDARSGTDDKKKHASKSWLPVFYSSSFAPVAWDDKTKHGPHDIRLIAMWSRTRACRNCAYIPLDEEVQAGWDVVGGENEVPGAIACPRCGSMIVPMLAIEEMSMEKALAFDIVAATSPRESSDDPVADFAGLPPQIGPTLSTVSGTDVHYVAYRSPSSVRLSLEQHVEEHGEEVLVRDRLLQLDPETFYNFWWYCARFSLPLPLPVTPVDGCRPSHSIAFVAWDHTVSRRGCHSAAMALEPLLSEEGSDDFEITSTSESPVIDPFDDYPLLSRFNLQGFYSSVWDHEDLSKILVTLVEACDKRDFKPVVECVLQCNKRRRAQFGPAAEEGGSEVNYTVDVRVGSDAGGDITVSVELDVYRTILYLAKYQCTTAFHAFFPATVKPCKGYHFWCAIGTPLPMFDRLLRDGVQRVRKDHSIATTVYGDVAEVALGFRCVFGHLV